MSPQKSTDPVVSPPAHRVQDQPKTALQRTYHYLVHNMLGFILAFGIRLLYNRNYSGGGDTTGSSAEAWPATQTGFLMLVPLALALQLFINFVLSQLGK